MAACSGSEAKISGESSGAAGEGQTQEGEVSRAAADGAASAGQAGSGSASAGAGGDVPVAPPTLACADRAPSAFVTLCSGCHGAAAAQDTRPPNLRGLTLSEADLIAQVRSGGEGMPAFGSESVSDAELREVYAYLKLQRDTKTPVLSLGSVKPLFATEPAPLLPISFVRDDGVLVTRGAGRVRQRHELEGTYNPFGPLYFEDRSYGFLIEDFTTKGESRIRVTYLPIARPEDKTNFRCFKVYGDGNVFSSNTGMESDGPLPSLMRAGRELNASYARDIAPYARVQSHEMTRNTRSGKPLAAGDLFEFEFGIFIEAGDVRAGSRTSYYTDTFRYRVGTGGLTAESLDPAGTLGPIKSASQGGATTIAWIYAEPELYFSQLALNVQHEHVQPFLEGRRLFHTDFATGEHSEAGNPVFSEQAKKLGPLFVAKSCTRCHVGNGGGRVPAGALDETSSLAFKLYGDAALGNQLQLSEGSARFVENVASEVSLADGSVVKLSRPRFEVKPRSGSTPRYSARIARRLVGLGLLEAVSEQTLLAQADPEDCDGDGISGRLSLIKDPRDGVLRVGRFGWRAEKVSVAHQVADALDADLGVSTRIVPGANGELELGDEDVARLVAYMRLLGVPAQRDVTDAQVMRGETVFRSVGCASCHLSSLSTGDAHPDLELRGQAIRPFTDLLLHDLGADLRDESGAGGDGMGAEAASASEWRTAPLWGIGLARGVQGYVALLHDGRAQSVQEAILWHGGEARQAREHFSKLSSDERAALLRFVDSL
jgi:CxxC motif-containing protein (DUF1111 family)/mono/diheme cytochrome c family protein